ncbi:hypothetical protein [Flavobacterium silvaticum]|uniref:Uncharacterized protein n=1 Tax=Flavobacterium silvaticum TaxID=1852020 RepID=A0A972FNH4_9FLAO|nr:hypothetical protein [Flavobacterium silvaticum]NMH26479.1 hypothetical protein [Flavobacterium silvaticum]
MTKNPTLPVQTDFLEKFGEIAVQSPTAIVTSVLSTLLGYGISFLIFDYRKPAGKKKASVYFHAVIGLTYTAFIFIVSNFSIMKRDMTAEDINKAMPFTLMISFAVAFLIIVSVSIYKEIKK